MKDEAFSKFESLSRYPIFQAVGRPLPRLVLTVQSWSEAIESCVSRKWENCRVQARNVLQIRMEDKSWERLRCWEGIVTQLKPEIERYFDKALVNLPVSKDRLRTLIPQLVWDFLFICLEQEYSDLVKPIFFLPQLDRWYSIGHFPCGWDGKQFPDAWDGIAREGQLIVF